MRLDSRSGSACVGRRLRLFLDGNASAGGEKAEISPCNGLVHSRFGDSALLDELDALYGPHDFRGLCFSFGCLWRAIRLDFPLFYKRLLIPHSAGNLDLYPSKSPGIQRSQVPLYF